MKRSENKPWVIPLYDCHLASVQLVGNKAERLSKLMVAGLPVPAGFCLKTAAFNQFIQLTKGIEFLFSQLDTCELTENERIFRIAAQIRLSLEKTQIPEEICSVIVNAWKIHGTNLNYAIRSSAATEDLKEASFAGQYDSFLNVAGSDAILNSIRHCWISSYSDRAIHYRIKNRISQQSVSMAVIVQEMIPADVSGIIFTANPLTGNRNQLVIESCFGLGEALVSGKVIPDRILLDRNSLSIITLPINCKTDEGVQDSLGQNFHHNLSGNEPMEGCLSLKMATQLAELALKAERLFQWPQDLEWAIRNGDAYLLQSRPITTGVMSTTSDSTIWTNVAIGEVIPDVMTPLSWSVLEILTFKPFVEPLLHHLGLPVKTNALMSLIAGRVYLNMTLLVDILRSFPFMSKVNLSEALGGSFELPPNFFSEHNFPRKPAFRFNQCIRFIGLSLGFLMHSGERRSRKMLLNLRQNLDQLQKDDVTEMSDTRLFTHLRNLFQRCCQITGDRSYAASILGAVGVGFGCVMLLFRLTRRWLRDDDGRIANRLISGAGGMDSAEAGFALGRLAGFARQYPSVKTSIMETDNFAKIEEMLQSTADGKEFLRHWQNFMDRHGHHTRGEIDVYNCRWREIPDYILSLLKSFLNAKDQNDLIQRKDELQKQRREILANCLRQLRNPVKRWVFTLVLFKAQQGLTVRENCKSEFVRMISIIRQSLLEVGCRLQKKGVFGEITDLFFLNDSELFSVLSGNVPVGIGEIIYSRKNEFGHHQKLKPPSTITGPFDCAVNSCEEIYEQIQELKGLAVSPGIAEGCAHVIMHADMNERLLPGEILVAPLTDPGWTPYFLTASGIVMDLGGQLTHGSIVAREYGIPAVANTVSATKRIRTGQRIRVDGNRGIVSILA